VQSALGRRGQGDLRRELVALQAPARTTPAHARDGDMVALRLLTKHWCRDALSSDG